MLVAVSFSLYAMVAMNLIAEKSFLPVILLILSVAAFALMSLELSSFGNPPRTRWIASREVPPPVEITAIWPVDERPPAHRWRCNHWERKMPPVRNDP